MSYTLTVSSEEDEGTRQALLAPLGQYNEEKAGPSNYQTLIVSLRDRRGTTIGGAWGYTAYGWLFVQFLVVPEHAHGSGLGKQLLAVPEREAISRGCHDAWLDTHEFQAKGFYERQGYALFGQLRDYPPPFSRYFFKKHLAAGLSAA